MMIEDDLLAKAPIHESEKAQDTRPIVTMNDIESSISRQVWQEEDANYDQIALLHDAARHRDHGPKTM
jgi:hypothetical protein